MKLPTIKPWHLCAVLTGANAACAIGFAIEGELAACLNFTATTAMGVAATILALNSDYQKARADCAIKSWREVVEECDELQCESTQTENRLRAELRTANNLAKIAEYANEDYIAHAKRIYAHTRNKATKRALRDIFGANTFNEKGGKA